MNQPRTANVLIVDNYDSFTFNLYQLIGGLGAQVTVVRNDAVDLEAIDNLSPTHIVFSPGPGHPGNKRDFGVCADVIRSGRRRPLLGVCLGHQGIAHHLGGKVVTAPQVMHGKVSTIRHDGSGLFAGMPERLDVMRYHSLTVAPEALPDCLRVTAVTLDGVVMGLAHRQLPIVGVQFHPESIGTPLGPKLIQNFLETE